MGVQGWVELIFATMFSHMIPIPGPQWILWSGFTVVKVTTWLFDTVLIVFVTSAVHKDERGTWMGFVHAMQALPTIVTPVVSKFLFEAGGVPAVYCFCACMS